MRRAFDARNFTDSNTQARAVGRTALRLEHHYTAWIHGERQRSHTWLKASRAPN